MLSPGANILSGSTRLLPPPVYYAMALDGLFLRSIAEVHPRFGSPARAIAVQAVLASLLVVLGTFSNIVAYFVFVAVLLRGLTVAGVIRLRPRTGTSEPLAVPGYPCSPLGFLTLVALPPVLLAAHNPLQSFHRCGGGRRWYPGVT